MQSVVRNVWESDLGRLSLSFPSYYPPLYLLLEGISSLNVTRKGLLKFINAETPFRRQRPDSAVVESWLKREFSSHTKWSRKGCKHSGAQTLLVYLQDDSSDEFGKCNAEEQLSVLHSAHFALLASWKIALNHASPLARAAAIQ